MTAPLLTSFDVACSAEHAFHVWTDRIGTWWPPDHTATGQADHIVLESSVGGRIYERTSDGIEHDWEDERALRFRGLRLIGLAGRAPDVGHSVSGRSQFETSQASRIRRPPTGAAGSRQPAAAAGRSGPPRSSGRRRRRRARGGTPAPGTTAPTCAPAPAGKPARRPPRTARPGASPASSTGCPGTRQPRHSATGPVLVVVPGHNESHGHRLDLQVLWKEPEDHQAVAASCHHDTPGNTSNS